MLTIDATIGQVNWGGYQLRPGLSVSEFERQIENRPTREVRPSRTGALNVSLPPTTNMNPILRAIMEQAMGAAAMQATEALHRAEYERQQTLRAYKMPAVSSGTNSAKGTLSFVRDRIEMLEFSFTLPGDDQGWAGYSAGNEQKRHRIGLELLEAQLGAPPTATSVADGGTSFLQATYPFAWGTVTASHDPRGGGTGVSVRFK